MCHFRVGSDGSVVTQFTMTTLEELGLLKMDFLGLRTLTVIQDAVRLAEKSSGKEIDIDAIDYNDKKVLDYIGSGETDGIFQLESGGMKGVHEGTETTESGRHYRRYLAVPSGTDGLHSTVY